MSIMMSPDNPFGLRPDELASALMSGHVGVGQIPSQPEMTKAIKQYDSSSSVKYTSGEKKYFNELVQVLNDRVVKPAQQAIQQPSQVQQVQQPVQSPFSPVIIPEMPLQQVQPAGQNNSGLLAGIDSSKVESYIVLGALFMIMSSILGLFRR